jgi:hypothetical protein
VKHTLISSLGHWAGCGAESSWSRWRKNSRTDTGDLNRSRSINAQQVKAEQKCPLHMAGGGAGSRRSTVLEVARPQAFMGAVDMGVVSPGKLGQCVINFLRWSHGS